MAQYFASSELTGSTTPVNITAPYTIRRQAVTIPSVGQTVHVCGSLIWTSGVLNLTINDVMEMCVLPAGCVPVDVLLVNDDFDTVTGIQINAGIMTGAVGDYTRIQTAVGAQIIAAASTVLQAAAASRHPVSAAQAPLFGRIAPTTGDRSIGIAVTAAPTTNPSTTRQLDLHLWYRVARYGL